MRFAAVDVVLSSDRWVFPLVDMHADLIQRHEFTGEVSKVDGEETGPKRTTCGCFAWLYLLADLTAGGTVGEGPRRPRMPRTRGDDRRPLPDPQPQYSSFEDSLLTLTSRTPTWS